MNTFKKSYAFAAVVKAFGPWNTWGRREHLVYGLIRGVEYSRMERCSNDNPDPYTLEYIMRRDLKDLKLWPEETTVNERQRELASLVVWMKKEPRVKRSAQEQEAAQ